MTRRVMVFKLGRPEGGEPGSAYVKIEVGAGNFHQFGCDFEEFDDGPGNYTTAIVEMPTGEVVSVPVNLIRFEDDDT